MSGPVLCVIGARGGSKGLPGKNVRPFLGKPLITWSIEQALACPEIDRVVVSTDSDQIALVAKQSGAEVPFLRPAELAADYVGKLMVWKHALKMCEEHYGEQYEIFVDLDCTNPLRDVFDISAEIRQFRNGRARNVDAVISVCAARKNPYFNILEVNEDGWLRMSKSLPTAVVTRQNAPKVYDHVASTYALNPAYIRAAEKLFEGRIEGYDIGEAKSLDIDSEVDCFLVEALMKHKLGMTNRD